MQTVIFIKNKLRIFKLRKFLTHILAISIFVFYENSIVLIISPASKLDYLLIFYIPALALFYINAHAAMKLWLLPRLKYFIPLIFCFEIIVYNLICLLIIAGANHLSFFDKAVLNKYSVAQVTWRGVYFLGISITYWAVLESIKNAKRANLLELRQIEGEKKRIELENAFLRTQINPHFIYNTINFVYGTVQSLSDKASRALLLLAEFVKYAFANVDENGKVDLAFEVEQIERCVEVNQLRFNNQLNITIVKSIEPTANFQIPPLILLSFVENMFSHGIMNNVSTPATIEITLTNESFHFKTTNFNRPAPVHESKRIGMANSLTRLMAFYPNQHSLSITTADNRFILDLKIDNK